MSESVICAECGSEAFPEDLYCENCSAPLPGAPPEASPATSPIVTVPAPRPCINCGGTDFQDGYCSSCGAPAVSERDHWQEQPAPWVAAVSDRGIRHHRNEDAMALSADAAPGSRAVLVVCDGVSSSADPDIASLGAARAARDVLAAAPAGGPSVAGRITSWTERITAAGIAANEQAVEASRHPSGRAGERDGSPSCTFVVGIVDGGTSSPLIVVGWVGDSRAYWIPDSGTPELMSVDDSWASEQILSGVPREVAENAPQAHAITRWLGLDSHDFTPRCSSTVPTGPGWLLVCSDGLWNYCSPAADMGALVASTAAAPGVGGDPARLANELVNWANAQGGMDNITVALARL